MKRYNYVMVIIVLWCWLLLTSVRLLFAQSPDTNTTTQNPLIAGIITQVNQTTPIIVINQTRWLNQTIGDVIYLPLRDEIRDRIYLTARLMNATDSEVVIINTKKEIVVKKLPISGYITDMSLSKDNAQLGVVSSGGIVTIDLNFLNTKKLTLPTEINGGVSSIAYDRNGRILCLSSGAIYLLTANGQTIIKKFGVGPTLARRVYNSLLKTDLTGTILYVGELGLYPARICKIDIRNSANPVFLAEDTYGELSGDLRDFTISPRYNELYLASGASSGIQVVNSNTLRLITVLNTGSYLCGVDVNRDGSRIYGLPYYGLDGNNVVYEFDAKSRSLVKSYQLLPYVAQFRGIVVERFAEKVFAIVERQDCELTQVCVVDVLRDTCANQ